MVEGEGAEEDCGGEEGHVGDGRCWWWWLVLYRVNQCVEVPVGFERRI